MWSNLKKLILVCSCFVSPVFGYFNIFLNANETLRILGLEAEIYYVREGYINFYAMSFLVTVPDNLDFIEFSWQSLTRKESVYYTITIEYNIHQRALTPPKLNIPYKGIMPTTVETFKVYLTCSKLATEQVPVSINLNVHKGLSRSNQTSLTFKRNKVCKMGPIPENRSPAPAYHQQSLLGATACALGLILVFSLIASSMYVRARKQLRQDSLNASFNTTAYGSHQNVFVRLDPIRPPSVNSGSYATIASLNKFPIVESKKSWFRSSASPYATSLLPLNSNHNNNYVTESIYAKPESYYASSQITQVCSLSTTPARSITMNSNPKEKLRRIAVSPGSIIEQHLIQQGTFSRVYNGVFHHPLGEIRDVLIKTVEDANLTQASCFFNDVSLFCGITHPNIHFPIAICTDTLKVAYQLPVKGNLKLFLQNSRETWQQFGCPLNTRQLVNFGVQIATGLLHIHSLGILHKDLAARNCVLDSEYCIRITDSALSRDLFPGDYECIGDDEILPIKWMSIETLERKDAYGVWSDIWSYGVLLWELSTLATVPYMDVPDPNLINFLRSGSRLEQPKNCPDEFYSLMSSCWIADYKQRPTMSYLFTYLTDFHENLGKYI